MIKILTCSGNASQISAKKFRFCFGQRVFFFFPFQKQINDFFFNFIIQHLIYWRLDFMISCGFFFVVIVVTRFLTPCLLEDWQKQMKEIFFRNLVWTVFCSLYPSHLLPKPSGFLRLIRSLHNAKFIPFLFGL